MTSYGIGARFRDERLRQNLSLDDIVARTRIQSRFLTAIEGDDLGQFPGIVFARNFVRQYAVALGLDPEPILAQLPRLDQETVRLPEAPARARARRTRLTNPLWTSVGWACAALAAGSGAWLYHNPALLGSAWHFFPGGDHKAPVAVEARSAPAPSNPAPPLPVAIPAPPADDTQPSTVSSPDSRPVASESAIPVSETPVVVPPPAPHGPVQVVVTAQEPAWVSVTTDSKSTFVGTLKPNETREISAFDQVKIVTGNAGGLTISLNGKMLDPLGPRGQVRTVRLTAEGSELLSKAPVPPVTPPADPL